MEAQTKTQRRILARIRSEAMERMDPYLKAAAEVQSFFRVQYLISVPFWEFTYRWLSPEAEERYNRHMAKAKAIAADAEMRADICLREAP